MAAVSLKKIEKVYPNGFKAVHGVDLEVRDGEFMVFVGPSGCAKSTLLRMIAGLESISGGELAIGGQVVNRLPAKQRGIAMVFQNYALYPHMTVFNNLAFGLKLAGLDKAEIRRRVHEAAELLELGALLERHPKQLSGGQAQRVAVGRAIVKRPAVFLFDEPLSNLDAQLRASMRVRLTELHQALRTSGQPATVIYVTHDQVEAMTMGERICVLKTGTVQQVDRPTVLYGRPANAFVGGFIGSPEMNQFTADMRDGALRWGDCVLPMPDAQRAAAGSRPRVRVGLRPEHVAALPLHAGAAPLPGRLRFVEHMGAEVYVHAEIGGQPVTARMAPDALGDLVGKARGDAHTFHLQAGACHLFDESTGQRL
ncbi:MAG: sn-glycerol-3-phosphate ABC transporter ATP-binding protein UgpC [Rubrivivax sp.]|nr:sn-glycerol-3-phosphate ABC transporter ATP-binding protein UgpC [Rubrivivax sp.]